METPEAKIPVPSGQRPVEMETPASTVERNLVPSFLSPSPPPTPILRRKCRCYFPKYISESVAVNFGERTPAPAVGSKRLHLETLTPVAMAASFSSPSPPPTPIVRRKCRCRGALKIQDLD